MAVFCVITVYEESIVCDIAGAIVSFAPLLIDCCLSSRKIVIFIHLWAGQGGMKFEILAQNFFWELIARRVGASRRLCEVF